MDLGMEGKVAFVTGGESGIGHACAVMVAEEGGERPHRWNWREAGQRGGRTDRGSWRKLPLRQGGPTLPGRVEAAVATAVNTFGRLDYAVNSAGVEVMKPFLEVSEKDWDCTNDINSKGVWSSMQVEIAAMLKSGGDAIVNISSIAGLMGSPKLARYVASKAGVIGITRNAAIEFAEQGIRVNAICPGTINTPVFQGGMEEDRENAELAAAMNPMTQLGTPEELDFAAISLCSEKAGYITGITVAVDGGWTQH